MRKLAKTLAAGTIAAIPLSGLWCGAATSQEAPPPNTVVNDQLQLGDVFAGQILVVQDTDGVITAATSALGQGVTATSDGMDVDVRSRQRLRGDVSASTELNVISSTGSYTGLQSTAVGNAQTSVVTGATMTGRSRQFSRADSVSAKTDLNAGNAWVGPVQASSQAVVNSHGIGAINGRVSLHTQQRSHTDAQANTTAYMSYAPYDAAFGASAVNNALTSSTEGWSQTGLYNEQLSTGDTNAKSVVMSGSVQNLSNAASAVANSASVNNTGGPLRQSVEQRNRGSVNAEAVTISELFGAQATVAYGVGNSSLAGEFGTEIAFSNLQRNSGDVSSMAASLGGTGYDQTASSVAIGNATTGFACAECKAKADFYNNQTNRGDISSKTYMEVSGSGRTTNGAATAVGNTATFYVTRPGG
jgi:hypothetical protein